MTIRKGEPWGVASQIPDEFVVVDATNSLAAALSNGPPAMPLAIVTGDLARTLGGRGVAPSPGAPATEVTLDLLKVTSGDQVRWAAAHVVVRRSWWRGPLAAAMNAEFIGEWDVAPRSHPNDGRLDYVEVDASMSIADRWKARQRLATGTHVPHPQIRIRQLAEVAIDVPRGAGVWIDGLRWTASDAGPRQLAVVVMPDACRALIPTAAG